MAPPCGGSPKGKDVSSTPDYGDGSVGQAVGQLTDSSICNSRGEAIARSSEVARHDIKPSSCMEESRQDVGKACSFSTCTKIR